MLKRAACAIAVCVAMVFASDASADLVITSEVVKTTPGSSVEVDFFAADPDGVGELTGVNLPVDIGIGADGNSIPVELTLGTPFVINTFGANVSYTPFAGAFNFDGIINVAQPPALPLTDSPQLIFSLSFDVSNLAVAGDVFDITLISSPEINGVPIGVLDVQGTDIGDETTATFGAGQIVINSPIPEPSSALLLGSGFMALVLRRKRS